MPLPIDGEKNWGDKLNAYLATAAGEAAATATAEAEEARDDALAAAAAAQAVIVTVGGAWTPAIYAARVIVTRSSLVYISTEITASTDVPGTSPKWFELPLGNDPIARNGAPHPARTDWAEIWVDSAGVMFAGVDQSGLIHNLGIPQDGGGLNSKALGGNIEAAHVDTDTAGLATRVVYADGSWFLDRLKVRDLTWTGLRGVDRIAFWGDSLTADNAGLGGSVPGYFQTYTTTPVSNYGVVGQTSSEVALRAGAVPITLSFTSNVVAAGAQTVTVRSSGAVWRTGSGYTLGSGYIMSAAGAKIVGTLTKSTSNVFTFTPAFSPIQAAGIAVPAEAPFVMTPTYKALGRARWHHVIRFGKNNLLEGETTPTTVVRDVRNMRAALRLDNLGATFTILPVYTDDASGTGGYTIAQSFNTALRDAFPGEYYDLRGWLIRNGLAAAGITPTAGDTTAITQDRIPPSLTTDTTPHLKLVGREVEALQVANFLRTRGVI